MKKIIAILLAFFLGFPAYSAQMVNVEYIHNAIAQKWDITVPYNPALTNPKVAANMKYLLSAVDVANKMLNGTATTYGTSEYATLAAADTVATNDAVARLIKPAAVDPMTPKFFATTTPDTTEFMFYISAKGTFSVDWGDGTVETIERTDTSLGEYTHTYATVGEYVIGLGGQATEYLPATVDEPMPAVAFLANANLAKISGSLGAVFPTIGDGRATGSQPNFFSLFYSCQNLTGSIPPELFDGVHGVPVAGMFNDTFAGCMGLTGEIPENLFAGISGAPAEMMFNETFIYCSGLTGKIPSGLFAGISGAPASNIFSSTFAGCMGLTGEIPENLFAGISGAPADSMFSGTFSYCPGLTGEIPENLFAGISGIPAEWMFSNTFAGSGVTGKIPSDLFVGISGAPAASMFNSTFSGCSGLTSIGDGLFAGIHGAPANDMFRETFNDCSGLTGPSARTADGKYLYEVWPDATSKQVAGCYSGATGLSDYDAIPAAWK